ncbi:LOW QUALITY PROTEIN: hypothetical protein HID58_022917, partial [Brassica napus]
RRAQRRARFDRSDRLPAPRSIPFDEVDCRPVIYHPGGIFEELPSLPREALLDWESRLPCVLGPRKSLLSLFTRKQQKLLNKTREMEGIPDLSALLKGKLQILSTKSSSAGASEVRPVPTDGDVNSEPPAQSSPKKKASKAKKRSVPLEEAPSSADASQVAAKKKKKKKDSKKKASVEVLETSTAAGDDDAGRHDPTDSTRGSSEERPKKKSKKTTAEDNGTPAPEIPSKSGGPRVTVPEGTAVEECPDKNDPEVGGSAIQEETWDVAAEDPVLVSSTRRRRGGDQEENMSSLALIEEAALNPSAPDPPAQIEGLNTHVAEETIESLDPVVSNKDDQDTVA